MNKLSSKNLNLYTIQYPQIFSEPFKNPLCRALLSGWVRYLLKNTGSFSTSLNLEMQWPSNLIGIFPTFHLFVFARIVLMLYIDAMSCKRDGFIKAHHDNIRDIEASFFLRFQPFTTESSKAEAQTRTLKPVLTLGVMVFGAGVRMPSLMSESLTQTVLPNWTHLFHKF